MKERLVQKNHASEKEEIQDGGKRKEGHECRCGCSEVAVNRGERKRKRERERERERDESSLK